MISQDAVKKKFTEVLGQKAPQFLTSITNVTYLLPGFHTRISHIREPVPAPVRSGILDGMGSYRILHTYSFCLQSSQKRRSVYRASEQIVLNLVLE